MPSTPSPDRIRLTISVTPEVHASFQRLAAASSVPIGRAMGEWLADTLEAVEFTASKVEQARSAPRLAMRELHGYAQGLVDETTSIMAKMRAGEVLAPVARSATKPALRRPDPPPSNTGGKGQPAKAGKARRGRS